MTGEHVITLSGLDAAIGGGDFNQASQHGATVGGGHGNYSLAERATIAGGMRNRTEGDYSAIPGGKSNKVKSTTSLAFGEGVEIDDPDSFIVAFFCDANPGKLGINEPNPTEALHVNGNAKITADIEIGDDAVITNNLDVGGKVTINDVLHLVPHPDVPTGYHSIGEIYLDNSTIPPNLVRTDSEGNLLWEKTYG